MLYDKFYCNTFSRNLPEVRQKCMWENNLFGICVNFNIKMESRIFFLSEFSLNSPETSATIERGSDKIDSYIEY